jgi:hypothetical protein
MTDIRDEQVEWAVVHRLKAMLDDPPKTEFNVTQTFAHFTAILFWTTQRIRVPVAAGPADRAAQRALRKLERQQITELPWSLSLQPPVLDDADVLGDERNVNADFVGMSVDRFTIWLRDSLAHGDGRNIRPIHKRSRRTGNEHLAGFCVDFSERRGAARMLRLHLHHLDMIRIGSGLANNFCHELSHGDERFEREANKMVVEAAE